MGINLQATTESVKTTTLLTLGATKANKATKIHQALSAKVKTQTRPFFSNRISIMS